MRSCLPLHPSPLTGFIPAAGSAAPRAARQRVDLGRSHIGDAPQLYRRRIPHLYRRRPTCVRARAPGLEAGRSLQLGSIKSCWLPHGEWREPVVDRLRQSALLAAGILLTIVAVAAHRFLPEKRLSLAPSNEGAVYFLMSFGDDKLTKVDWVDQSRLHFRCRLAEGTPGASCSYTYLLYKEGAPEHGVDLSRYRKLNLRVRYTGNAH